MIYQVCYDDCWVPFKPYIMHNESNKQLYIDDLQIKSAYSPRLMAVTNTDKLYSMNTTGLLEMSAGVKDLVLTHNGFSHLGSIHVFTDVNRGKCYHEIYYNKDGLFITFIRDEYTINCGWAFMHLLIKDLNEINADAELLDSIKFDACSNLFNVWQYGDYLHLQVVCRDIYLNKWLGTKCAWGMHRYNTFNVNTKISTINSIIVGTDELNKRERQLIQASPELSSMFSFEEDDAIQEYIPADSFIADEHRDICSFHLPF